MNRLQAFFFRAWRPAVTTLLLASIAYLVLFQRLGSLVPGYSPGESATYHASQHFKDIVANPLNAPYKAVVYATVRIAPHHLVATRVVSAIFAVLACALFFVIVRAWISYRIAFLSTILFASSSGLLHAARLGTPAILQLAVLLLLGGALWLQRTSHRAIVLYAGAIILLSALYIPGFIWFELLGLALWRKDIMAEVRRISWQHLTLAGVGTVLMLAPLVRACVIFPSTIRGIFGLPDTLPTLHQFLANGYHAILSIGIRSYGSADMWLHGAPLLNVIELALLALGIAVFVQHWALARTKYIAGSIVLGGLLISLGGPVGFTVLLPILYLLIAVGLYELLTVWLSTFPRNPIARSTGIFFIFCLIFISSLYQWRAYFIAWPHNAATRSTFTLHE